MVWSVCSGAVRLCVLITACSAPVDSQDIEAIDEANSDLQLEPSEPLVEPIIEAVEPGALPGGLRFVIDIGRPAIVLGFAEDESAATGPIERITDGNQVPTLGVAATFRRV